MVCEGDYWMVQHWRHHWMYTGWYGSHSECNPLPPCQLWWENKELLYYSVVKNLPATQELQEMWVQFLGQEDHLKEGIIPIPIFGLPWWLRHLPAMQETWVWSLGQEDPLEKEMATHCSTLAWKIPRTEEPCRLQSLGSQRAGHDWATSLHFFTSYNSDTSGSFLQKGRQKWNQQGNQNLCPQIRCEWNCSLPAISYWQSFRSTTSHLFSHFQSVTLLISSCLTAAELYHCTFQDTLL